MKLKTSIGMFLAFALLIGMAVACLWLVGKMREVVSENSSSQPENSASQTPENRTDPTNPINPTNNEPTISDDLALGNPSNATTNASNANNYLMINESYALSYNREKAIPNWVSWELSARDIGDSGRQNDFRPDERLPYGWVQIMPNDYSRSGFDRGHTCPSGDRTNSMKANSATFLMTNMTPQTHDLNTGPWEKLESYSRSLARRGNDLYIIAGTYGTKGKINGKVAIPTNDWKIVVVVPKGKGLSGIDANTRVIAVDMPNVDGIGDKNWRDYKTTVRQIEQKTGYNFLSNVPKNVQEILETRTDTRTDK